MQPQEIEGRQEAVRHQYDANDAIITTFVDPETRMYTCAYFPQEGMTLGQAQIAKTDHTLAKLDLRPGETLLDIGSGYGYALRRAQELYGVNGVGLNLSPVQLEHSRQVARGLEGLEYRLEGWETYEGRIDAIVVIGSFEHFGRENYPAFFAKAQSLLPAGGLMLLHTITFGNPPPPDKKFAFGRYSIFMKNEIFPGGELPYPDEIRTLSSQAGFELLDEESLQPHYAKTLDRWADNLAANRDKAIVVAGEKTFDKYLQYLMQSADWFRRGTIDVRQFLFRANNPKVAYLFHL
ncbi:class I SAM-dependent methyltransferase [Candidatus Shapirobacteria bacterium]|nr:class I SAM-dependent methyltransferase [Candidatus Shapirobacteria bacterium]